MRFSTHMFSGEHGCVKNMLVRFCLYLSVKLIWKSSGIVTGIPFLNSPSSLRAIELLVKEVQPHANWIFVAQGVEARKILNEIRLKDHWALSRQHREWIWTKINEGKLAIKVQTMFLLQHSANSSKNKVETTRRKERKYRSYPSAATKPPERPIQAIRGSASRQSSSAKTPLTCPPVDISTLPAGAPYTEPVFKYAAPGQETYTLSASKSLSSVREKPKANIALPVRTQRPIPVIDLEDDNAPFARSQLGNWN